MPKRRLPIGMQTFRELRERDCYYVDKTAYIERLLAGGKHYFLSRPRRFGKSLFLDTLKELFEGSEGLFAGLHIHAGWEWSKRHPVVRLDFGRGHFGEPGLLEANVMEQLAGAERRAGVVSEYLTAPGRFAYLLEALHERTGQRVAVLVDEYDKPILDALDAPETALANRDFLRGLYGVIKSSDAHVHFTFLTGVVTKVSVFSQLNNLTDLTLDRRYSAIAGTPSGIWMRCSRRSLPDWTASRCGSGTTATAGAARRRYTTPTTCCCCSTAANSPRTGSRRGRRRSWWRRCSSAASPPCPWTGR